MTETSTPSNGGSGRQSDSTAGEADATRNDGRRAQGRRRSEFNGLVVVGELGVLRYSTAHLLIALVLLLVLAPMMDHILYGSTVSSVAITLVLASAVLAVGGSPRTLAIAGVLSITPLVAEWYSVFHPSQTHRLVGMGSAAVFVAYIVAQLLLFVLRARHVGTDVLCAAISAYLLVGFLFAFIYSMVSLLNPEAIQQSPPGSEPAHPLVRFDAIYFSFVTLSTVGYGDIVPVSRVARMLAMLEAIGGMFYLSVLIARLVSLYSRQRATLDE